MLLSCLEETCLIHKYRADVKILFFFLNSKAIEVSHNDVNSDAFVFASFSFRDLFSLPFAVPGTTSQSTGPAHPLSKRSLDLSHMPEAIQDLGAAPRPCFYPGASLALWKPPHRHI